MLTIKVGKAKLAKSSGLIVWFLRSMMVIVPMLLVIVVVLQFCRNPFHVSSQSLPGVGENINSASKQSAGTCSQKKDCPEDQFSFFIQSGAANVVGPQICVQNNLILGTILNNAGPGINIVTLNGKTGEVVETANFNMYSGEVEPLIKFLKSIKDGSVVLLASFDEPSTKLNKEARNLIAELGSSMVQSVGFRDSWVFVGGKGTMTKSDFEKHTKNEQEKNKYEQWPELLQLDGCLPKFLE